jgi:CubicO group peptidase (beta-lactamase class C family)
MRIAAYSRCALQGHRTMPGVKRMRLLRLSVIVLALTAPLSAAWAAKGSVDPTVAAKIDAFVAAEMRRQQVPGVAVGVVRGARVFLAHGYGSANVEHDVPVTAHTLFQSGSVGKQFTALLVMLQVEDGKLALDEPLTRYFTDAPASWQAITARHLLTHTSGIREYTDSSSADGAAAFDPRRDRSEEQLVREAYARPLQFAPGSRWHYSNTGYAILGALVRRVCGRYYGDLLQQRVFVPLGMKTARIISEEDIVWHRAAGYRLVDGQLKNQEWVAPTLNTTADGSLYLALADMIAWDRGLRAGALLTPASWQQIYTPVRLASGRSYPYGFGWEVDEWRGKAWYHHGGSWQGFRTYISRYLAADLTIIVLANLADASPERFVDGIAAILEPTAPRIEPRTPIADSSPELTLRMRQLLAAAERGEVTAADLGELDPDRAEAAAMLAETIARAGSLKSLVLVGRHPAGDETASSYLAVYPAQTYRIIAATDAAGRLVEFSSAED